MKIATDDRPCLFSFHRTPFGKLNGALAQFHPADLGSVTLKASLERCRLDIEELDAVLYGNALSGFVGQNPTKQVLLSLEQYGPTYSKAHLVSCVTYNIVCNSSMEAIFDASRRILLGEGSLYAAGGFESMSRAYNIRNDASDNIALHDGLTSSDTKLSMGELAASIFVGEGMTRQELDDVAVRSYTNAFKHCDNDPSVIILHRQSHSQPLEYAFREAEASQHGSIVEANIVLKKDERLARFDAAKLKLLKPCFPPDTLLTAGNSSSLGDGAATILVSSLQRLQNLLNEGRCLQDMPYLEVLGYAYSATKPCDYISAPLDAVSKVLKDVGLASADVSRYRITEAFAGIVLLLQRKFDIPTEKINVRGDAIAYGHPLGVSACRIVGDLLVDLEVGQIGVATSCNGGGGACAICVAKRALTRQ